MTVEMSVHNTVSIPFANLEGSAAEANAEAFIATVTGFFFHAGTYKYWFNIPVSANSVFKFKNQSGQWWRAPETNYLNESGDGKFLHTCWSYVFYSLLFYLLIGLSDWWKLAPPVSKHSKIVLCNKPIYRIGFAKKLQYRFWKAPKMNIEISEYRYRLQYRLISAWNGIIGSR